MRVPTAFPGLKIPRIAALLLFLCMACARVCALDPKAMQAMVIVEGDRGRGSAFVVRMDGKTYLVTNSHVVRGNTNVKFKNLRNEVLAAGPLQIADRVDAVRAEFTGPVQSLELARQIEQNVKIGDAVIVAGNSEGEGVVREIPGKVVGIGPDRIEVDAEFVPGNSGSPILLKSTGEVIGVATYMKVPFSTRAGQKSPFSLNEVRRFGYRLDTVAKWVSPQPPDRIVQEGVRLAEMESVMMSVFLVLNENASMISKSGAGNFVSKEQRAKSPNAAALANAIDGFVRQHEAAKNDDERKKNTADFFEKLRAVAVEEVRGVREDSFSGFYAEQFKEHMKWHRDFIEWFEGTGMPAFREAWLASKPQFDFFISSSVRNKPKIDPAKLKFALTDRVEPNEPADYCHHVFYPAASQPANLDDIYWIIERPKSERTVIKMHKTNLRVRTSDIGTYRVYVEYRGEAKPRVVSNVVEVKFTAVTAAAAGIVPAAPAEKAKPETDAAVIGDNLLKNPNFERGMEGWEFIAYGKKGTIPEFGKSGELTVDARELRNGKPTLRIELREEGFVFVKQAAGKPNTHYRLTGYVKTKDVEPVKKGGNEGARLMIGFTAEVRNGTSAALQGTNPWKKVSFDFTTTAKPDIKVGPGLGYYNSNVTGTAWFSELSLMEIAPPSSAPAKVPGRQSDAETTSKPGQAAAAHANPAAAGVLPDWNQLAERIGRNEWQPSGIAGHKRTKEAEDLGDAKSILIGFDVAITPFGKSQETVRGVSPVFLAKDGEVKGGIYGEKNRKDVRRIVAKPGYAVGAVSAQFDGMAYRRMKVRFDRIKGFALDPGDTYETDWIGTYPENLKEGKADTDGRLPVGIAISYGLGVDGIGLLGLKP